MRLPFNSGSDSHQLLVSDEIKPRTYRISWCGAPLAKLGEGSKVGCLPQTCRSSCADRCPVTLDRWATRCRLPAKWLFAVGTPIGQFCEFSSVNNTLTPTRFCLLFCGRNLNCGSVNRSEIKFPFVWCVICHRFTVAIVRTRTKQVGRKRGVPGYGT